MKSIILSFLAVMVTALSFGQIKEGHVVYNIEMSSDDPSMAGQLSMFEGSKMEMYFSPDFGRVEFNFGMLMNMVTIANHKSKDGLLLMSGMIGNKAVHMTKEDMEEQKAETPDITIEDTGETKKILGHKCKKYLAITEDGAEISYWTTTDIVANSYGNQYMNEKISGFPLEFETNQQGMKMTFVATSFEDSLKGKKTKELFSMEIPEGYDEMTMEEINAMGM